MPLYDYHCINCDHTFEEAHTVDDRALPTHSSCPICNHNTIEILIGAPSLVDPIRIGVKKPTSQFVERMKHIKKRLGPKTNINI